VGVVVLLLSFLLLPPFGQQHSARVLLLGLDKAEEGTQRSDTIIVCVSRLNDGSTTLISIPRDSRIHIPGYQGYRKINATYTLGREALIRKTLAQPALLHADLPYYVVLDSDTTRAVVDAMGGVEVTVPVRMKYDDNWGGLHIDLHPGKQLLNGKQAVGFLRWRKNNHGVHGPGGDDIKRGERQRELLHAMITKLRGWPGCLKGPDAYRAFRAHARTNIKDYRQFLLLAWSAREMHSEALPSDPHTHAGISYVDCDWRQGREMWRAALGE